MTEQNDATRRRMMQAAALGALGVAAGQAGLGFAAQAQAQTAPAPGGGEAPWWPSKWGKDDEAGSTNHINPAKVLDTVKLIRDGTIYSLGHDYEPGMPVFGARAYALRTPGGPTGGPFGTNKMVYNDEFIATEIGQVGTQFDGLGHIGIQQGEPGDQKNIRYYNGFTAVEVNGPYGLKKLGIEKLKPIFTRGHLIDLVALKGGMMDAGQEITVADIRAALERQRMREDDIKPGDAILFHTGWGSLWMKDNARFNGGEPGIGMGVARWVIEKDLCLTGADTWAVEVVPNPDKDLVFAVHSELQAKHGIVNHENLVFDALIRDGKYQFAFIFTPVPFKGATGSPGAPIAVT